MVIMTMLTSRIINTVTPIRFEFLLLLLLAVIASKRIDCNNHETIKTIVYKDSLGLEHEEYAFREPSRGLPHHVIDMFCSSVKVRLYWNGYRDQIVEGKRKGYHLKRMARLARHIFHDIRDADKPFNATMLSRLDEHFGVNLDKEDEKLDKAIASRGSESDNAKLDADMANDNNYGSENEEHNHSTSISKIKILKQKISKKLHDGKNKLTSAMSFNKANVKEVLDEVESSDAMKDLEKEGEKEASVKIKHFIRKWGPKVLLGIYTRWRTMWWMMMSCLYTKYYLWDPALDEFTKLKRNLVMWPEFQLAKMHELECKPLIFFKRLMDICKIMNPLMNIDFGQFNLEKMTRFKGDSN